MCGRGSHLGFAEEDREVWHETALQLCLPLRGISAFLSSRSVPPLPVPLLTPAPLYESLHFCHLQVTSCLASCLPNLVSQLCPSLSFPLISNPCCRTLRSWGQHCPTDSCHSIASTWLERWNCLINSWVNDLIEVTVTLGGKYRQIPELCLNSSPCNRKRKSATQKKTNNLEICLHIKFL